MAVRSRMTALPMTALRRVALAIGVPLALATIGLFGLSVVAEFGQGSYPVNLSLPVQGSQVSLALDSGDATIGPVGGHRLVVRGVARYALDRSQVSWRRTGGARGTGLSVTTRCHQITGDCSFSLNVGVPVTPAAVISAGSGNLTVHDLARSLTLRLNSGDAQLDRLTGPVSVTGGSGNVKGTGLSGGRLSVREASGDITLTGVASADVIAVAGSGNVMLNFSKVPALVAVHSSSGDVVLVLPPGATTYLVSASASSGTTSVRVPQSPRSQHVIRVTVGSGNIIVMTG